MLQSCVLDLKCGWDENLPLVVFAYNSSYQASIQMTPSEALYGSPSQSLVCWKEVGESSIIGSDMIRDTVEKVDLLRKFLLIAESLRKSYVDRRR